MAVFLAVLLTAVPAVADSTVTVLPTGVTVVATATPVSEVLDRLARQTGMKVQYEGAVPRTLVTTRIERATAAEAVLAVLEGLGLGYALRLDPSGRRVESLLMLGSSSSSGPVVSRPTAPPPVPVSMNPEPPVMPDDVAFEEMMEPEDVPNQPPVPPEAGQQKPEAPSQAPPSGSAWPGYPPGYSPFAPPTPPPLTAAPQPAQPSPEVQKKPE
jgi:hypothetical protein